MYLYNVQWHVTLTDYRNLKNCFVCLCFIFRHGYLKNINNTKTQIVHKPFYLLVLYNRKIYIITYFIYNIYYTLCCFTYTYNKLFCIKDQDISYNKKWKQIVVKRFCWLFFVTNTNLGRGNKKVFYVISLNRMFLTYLGANKAIVIDVWYMLFAKAFFIKMTLNVKINGCSVMDCNIWIFNHE